MWLVDAQDLHGSQHSLCKKLTYLSILDILRPHMTTKKIDELYVSFLCHSKKQWEPIKGPQHSNSLLHAISFCKKRLDLRG